MEISYWQSRWHKNNTGWHMDDIYPLLTKLWPRLSIKPDTNVLVPLCGKSLDLHWLTDRGHHVTGVEVSRKALRKVMDRHSGDFTEDASHGFTIYHSELLELWEGDFLKLPANEIPKPDIIYDKAAIVALPPERRELYARKLLECCGKHTQILLQTFEYNQEEMNGPPFSVTEEELNQLLGKHFEFTLMHEQSKMDELSKFQRRGLSSYLIEKVYHLKPVHRE